MGIHDGHRERMKERFLKYGLENFNDLNALELLLFFALPRRDTNPTAHALLERFGSFDGVLDASVSELEQVSGVGENAALLLTLIPAVSRRYMLSKTPEKEPVTSSADAGRYFLPRFMYEREEVVLAAFLDARSCPIACRELSRGVVNATEINARRLASAALEMNASAVILAHNHPSGVALPSAEDEQSTMVLSRALSLLGVELRDHIIVADCGYVSMRECGVTF